METKNKKLRNSIIIFIAIALIGISGVFLIMSQKQNVINELNSRNSSLGSVLDKRDSVVNELVKTFDEIESSLDSINMKRNKLALAEAEGGIDQKQKVIDGILQIDEMLDKSSEKIIMLEKRLKSSGIELKSFRNKIAGLTKNVEQQNTQIAQLRQQLDERDLAINDLNQKVITMEDVIAMAHDSLLGQEEVIRKKDDELNRGYVAYGTSKELKERGLLANEGGFLGIGSNKVINDDFDSGYFIPLDIRETTFIPLHSRKARIISDHPDSSYRFVEEGGEIALLEIENPAEFWKLSKYALIEIKE